ncbi:MAG TPA: hypothetical protein PKK39_04375 [Tepidiformaceae bacterium]|jgi:hypothetical protein|nr:MAG: hypothetical protein EKK55_02245 [Rhodocyclaceae bacterium]HNO65560.1 hypothetical protein [Tepidiformaceae bacterium]
MSETAKTYQAHDAHLILRRVLDFEERKAKGECVSALEERLLRMDLRECIGVTGEGIPWKR